MYTSLFIYRTGNKSFCLILLFEHGHKVIFTYHSTRKQKISLILQYVVLQHPFRKFRHNLIPEVLMNKSVLVKHKGHLLWKRKKQSDNLKTLKPSFLLTNMFLLRTFYGDVLGCSFPWKAMQMPWIFRQKFRSQLHVVYVHSNFFFASTFFF